MLAVALAFLTVSCVFIVPSAKAQATENSWQEMVPMPTGRSWLGVAVIIGTIFAIGGLGGSGTANEMYDPASNSWAIKAPLPMQQFDFGVAVYNNKIYCIGGTSNGNKVGNNNVYDPTTNTWTQLREMPTPRTDMTANIVDGKIYIIGGTATKLDTNVNEVYDIVNDTWTTKTPMPTPSEGYNSAVIGHKIYIIGGYHFEGFNFLQTAINKLQIYNCDTDSWGYGTPMPQDQWAASAAVTSGEFAPQKIYVIGGTTWAYSPESNIWSQGATMPTNRVYMGLAVVNDLLYAIGGSARSNNGTVYAVNERYTPFGFSGQYPESSASSLSSVVIVAGVAVAGTVIVVTGVMVYHFKHAPAKAAKAS
jgi:hypothetical protein